MANRDWVGGSGNWDASTTTHWSSTSGGSGGASVPTSSDDVFVDSLSGSSPTITTTAAANCLSLNFIGSITPTITGTFALSVYGSLTFISAMTVSMLAGITFKATSTGKTITTAGKAYTNSVFFDGVGGGWALQDAFSSSTNAITLTNGSLNSNGFSVTCGGFVSNNSNARSLTLGNSTITINNGNWTFTNSANLTFSAGTSTISMTTNGSSFSGGGLTYNNVTLTGTPMTILGSSTFNTLTFTAGKTVNITSGTTQTASSFVANGTAGNLITIKSLTSGVPCTIRKTSGTQIFDYCTIKDCSFTGGADFFATNSVDGGGNTGISFGNTHKVMGQFITKINKSVPVKVNGV